MTAALKEDKVDFVRLAIQNGVIPKKFLTRDKLKDLYFEVSFINYFLYILKSSWLWFCEVTASKIIIIITIQQCYLIIFL